MTDGSDRSRDDAAASELVVLNEWQVTLLVPPDLATAAAERLDEDAAESLAAAVRAVGDQLRARHGPAVRVSLS